MPLREFSEPEGVKAIIELQKLVGIDEPEERARQNWNMMSTSERQSTMMAYAVFVPRMPE